MERKNGFNTRLLHDKTSVGYAQREILPPVSQVNAFRYESAEELEKVFRHKSAGFAYTRVGNPTTAAFERRINELEGGVGAVATSSGMAAITAALLTVAQNGDEIIAGTGLYGGTIDLFRDFEKFGIRVVYARETSEETIRTLITDKTRAVFAELVGNPSLAVLDVPKVSAVAHAAGVPLFVDSTTATPYLVRPLELGADVVIHSTSKYINGGGNSIGGIVVDGGKFPWDFEKHKALAEFSKYGKLAFSVRLRTDLWENFGACMAPTNAFLSYVGADTLGLRMERICHNAEALANALTKLPDVEVNYPTLRGNAFEELAKSELSGRGGGILTFRAGSKERAFKILDALKFAIIASNIGDLRTLIIHPASTLYLHSSREETEAAGVYDDTIRVSVGIEDVDDLIDDFVSAIKASREP